MDAQRTPRRRPHRDPSSRAARATARWRPDPAASEGSREEFASAGVGASKLRERRGDGSQLVGGELENPLEPLEECIELSRRPVIGAAADNRFTRVKQEVQ